MNPGEKNQSEVPTSRGQAPTHDIIEPLRRSTNHVRALTAWYFRSIPVRPLGRSAPVIALCQ